MNSTNFKRLVRARMKLTGESYMVAMRVIQEHGSAALPAGVRKPADVDCQRAEETKAEGR